MPDAPLDPARVVTAQLLLSLINQTGHAQLAGMSHAVDLIILHEQAFAQLEIELEEIVTLLREQGEALRSSASVAPDNAIATAQRGITALAGMLDEKRKALGKLRTLRDKTAALLDATARDQIIALKSRAARESTPSPTKPD